MAGFFFSFNGEEENWCPEMLKAHRKKSVKCFHAEPVFYAIQNA